MEYKKIDKKPCNCIFCIQFLFNRIRKYNYDNNYHINHIYQNDDPKISNKLIEKVFTIDDLDNIRFLKSIKCDTTEISKQTNLSYSMVEYIIKMISW